MKIKPLGYKLTDEKSGMVFELIPRTKEATQELVENFFEKFQISKVETEVKQEPKQIKEPKSKRQKQKKRTIPNSVQRWIKELTDLPDEFTIRDIGDLFEKDGYNRKKIVDNSYHDIYNLTDKNKIIYIEDTKPKQYKIVSRDIGDLK